jgi:IMP dehydrogenase/GMP reductase
MEINELLNELHAADLILPSGDGGWRVNPSAKMLYKSLGFDDVAIAQDLNVLNSRLDADTSSEAIRGVKLEVPLISANMSTVTTAPMCIKLAELGALGILHRAWSNTDDYLTEARKLADVGLDWRAASVGVTPDNFELVDDLQYNGINIIVIDIAHGFAQSVVTMAEDIKLRYDHVKVVVGNVTNVAALEVFDGISDAVKVGTASGLACRTKNVTGCFEQQFTAVMKFKEEAKRLGMPIISDGGIREPADFCKAIGAGASAVMAGSVFAACDESAAGWDDPPWPAPSRRIYSGMSSLAVQQDWRGGLKKGTAAEGTTVYLKPTGPVADLVDQYAGALMSAITYAGAVDVKTFQERVKFIRIT